MSDTTFSEHHILPLKLYLGVGAILLVLTAVTVGVSYFDFGSLNIVVAMLIALVKAGLVILYFMHLKYDNRIYTLVFLLALLMLGTFITLTMVDTARRGEINSIETHPIREKAEMYDKLPVAVDSLADTTGNPPGTTTAPAVESAKTK